MFLWIMWQSYYMYCYHTDGNRGCIDIFWIYNVRCPRTFIMASHYEHTQRHRSFPSQCVMGNLSPQRIGFHLLFLAFFLSLVQSLLHPAIWSSLCYCCCEQLKFHTLVKSHLCTSHTRTLHINSWIIMTKYIYTLQFCDVLYPNEDIPQINIQLMQLKLNQIQKENFLKIYYLLIIFQMKTSPNVSKGSFSQIYFTAYSQTITKSTYVKRLICMWCIKAPDCLD